MLVLACSRHLFPAQEQTGHAKVNVEGPFKGRKRKDHLSSWCKVGGIPSFVVFVKIGTIITRDGRAAVSGDPTGVGFPWYPTKSRQFSMFARRRMFLHKAFLEAMTPIAEKFIAEANAQGEDSPRMAFLIVTE